MLIDLNKTIVYTCPVCGINTIKKVKIFDFSGKKDVAFPCSAKNCNTDVISVKIMRNDYVFTVECPFCDDKHSFRIKKSDFWSKKPVNFTCPLSDEEIFYAGTDAEANKVLDSFSKDDPREFDETELLDMLLIQAQIMMADHRVSCICGSDDIDISLKGASVVLRCKRCGRTKEMTATEENVNSMFSAEQIILGD